MKRSILGVLIGLGVVFVFGAAVIVAKGRPVAQMAQDTQTPSVSDTSSSTTPDEDDGEESEYEDEDEGENEGSATPTTDTTTSVTPTTTDTTMTTTTPGAYTMADVARHATASDCWSAVNGNVYDLTSWVSRHPGGSGAIVRMCGTDGSARFNRQHAGFTAALDTLVLLKIGTLAP